MIYKENFEGIKLDIQTVDTDLNDKVKRYIKAMIRRLRRHFAEFNWVDIYFRKESSHSTGSRSVSVRLGIPGNDVFASESGIDWITLLRIVEERLARQLKRRKKRHSIGQTMV